MKLNCRACGKRFTQNWKTQIFCSKTCRKKYHNKKRCKPRNPLQAGERRDKEQEQQDMCDYIGTPDYEHAVAALRAGKQPK